MTDPVPTRHLQNLLEAIKERRAEIAVIGLGYVGLPLVRAFWRAGFSCLGFDIDPGKITSLMAGRSYIGHIPDSDIAEMLAERRFRASSDYAALAAADAVMICVPTPLTADREPDLSFVMATAKGLAPHLRPGQLVVLESTTYPGTTREELTPALEARGLVAGRDFFVGYSPEREDPANPHYYTGIIPKVVAGDGPAARQVVEALYGCIVKDVVLVSDCDTAEAAKLLENIFRSVNVALVNELKVIFEAMGIDVWEVIEAAATKPFGFMPFYPGPGLGGHCIPIDPFYLSWKARRHGTETRFIELAGEINRAMPAYVVAKVAEALKARGSHPLKGARILILGLAYKKNVDDPRESPSLVIWEMLESAGAIVDYAGPSYSQGAHHPRTFAIGRSPRPPGHRRSSCRLRLRTAADRSCRFRHGRNRWPEPDNRRYPKRHPGL